MTNNSNSLLTLQLSGSKLLALLIRTFCSYSHKVNDQNEDIKKMIEKGYQLKSDKLPLSKQKEQRANTHS